MILCNELYSGYLHHHPHLSFLLTYSLSTSLLNFNSLSLSLSIFLPFLLSRTIADSAPPLPFFYSLYLTLTLSHSLFHYISLSHPFTISLFLTLSHSFCLTFSFIPSCYLAFTHFHCLHFLH